VKALGVILFMVGVLVYINLVEHGGQVGDVVSLLSR
jgi:hypothetical protein